MILRAVIIVVILIVLILVLALKPTIRQPRSRATASATDQNSSVVGLLG